MMYNGNDSPSQIELPRAHLTAPETEAKYNYLIYAHANYASLENKTVRVTVELKQSPTYSGGVTVESEPTEKVEEITVKPEAVPTPVKPKPWYEVDLMTLGTAGIVVTIITMFGYRKMKKNILEIPKFTSLDLEEASLYKVKSRRCSRWTNHREKKPKW